jgi:hypothetical protein
MHSQTIPHDSQLRKCTGCSHTLGITPTGASTRGTPGNMNPANTNLPHLAELPVRGIVKAARIVTNVVAQPGDFYAGMRRRWLLHLGELTFKSEGSLSYHFSLVLLGGRGIVEATGVVGNAIAPCCKMSARITHIIMSALRIDKKKRARAYRNCVMFRCDQSVFEAAALPPVLTLSPYGAIPKKFMGLRI